MAVTSNTYTVGGSGQAGPYSYSFPILADADIKVSVDAVVKTVTTHYTVDSANTRITFVSGQEPATGAKVIIYRDTDEDPIKSVFSSGSTLRSTELNDNFNQLLYIAQETEDQAMSTLGGTMQANFTLGKGAALVFEGSTDDANETTVTVADPTADRTITIPNVTGTVVTTGDTGTVSTAMIAHNAVTTGIIGTNQVTSVEIANGAVQTDQILNNSVTAAKIADDAIDTAAIIDDAVDGTKIADNAINSEHYTDGSIDVEHLADNSVDRASLVADAVDGTKIADDSIDSEHIVDGSVDLAHLSTNSVDTTKIVDGTIVAGDIANTTITGSKLVNDTITATQIAANAVTASELADDAVDTAAIVDNAVTVAKIAADAITGAKLADDAVNSEHYTDASIDTAHIADGQVTAVKVASNAVTTSKITDANVTTDKLANDSVTIGKIGCEQTTISDSDSHLPTSGAVVDYVAAQLAPIGGLEVIANDASFPEVQPSAGVVISIADAGGLVVNGSGVSTTGRTVASTPATVTINGINSQFNSTTVDAGVAMMVSSTGSGQIYNYHKATLKEADLLNLSGDINDFAERYRVSSNPDGLSDKDEGDLVYDTNANKMKVYDNSTSAWKEVTSTGDFKYLFLCPAGGSGAPTLNGSIATYDLREASNSGSAASVTNAAQLLVSINGIVQKANTGTSAPSEGFAMVDANTIIFGANLASGDSVFIVQIGSAVSIPVPGDGTVSAAKIASGAVTTVKIADANVTTAKLASDAVTGALIADDAVGAEHIEVLDANLQLADSAKIQLGTGNDLEIFHDGSHSYIKEGGTGNLYISASSKVQIDGANDETMARFNEDGGVELYYDNSKMFATAADGVVVTGVEGGAANLYLHADEGDDNADKARIQQSANGDIWIQNYSSGSWETHIAAYDNGAVELYYDNTKEISTKSGGVKLWGHSESIVTALTSASTVTIDFGLSNHFSCTMGHNITFANPTTESVGQSGTIVLTQDGTGSRTASWGSQFLWAGGTAPTLSTGANAVDRIDYFVAAADKIHCVASLAMA